jgi:hypothetical protein
MKLFLQPLLGNTVLVLALQACGGYQAADEDDLEPRAGEIVGILVDANGKAHPDASVELYASDATSALQRNEGMDSDGRFGVFPPSSGTYSVVGILGETDKVIMQNIEFVAGEGLSIGRIATQKVAGLSFRVVNSENAGIEDVNVELLGYQASTKTQVEGAGLFETGIPAGTYKLRLSMDGLETKTVENIRLEPETVTVLENIMLEADRP